MITKKQQLQEALFDLGWKHRSSEGQNIFTKYIDDHHFVGLTPSIRRKMDGGVVVSTNPGFGDWRFCCCYAYIADDKATAWPQIMDYNLKLCFENGEREDVIKMSSEAIDWALQQNYPQILHTYSEMPTNAPGNAPLRHLTALAMLSRIDVLHAYIEAFESGNRLGFVPYINIGIIDRAYEIASSGISGFVAPVPS